MLHNDMENVTFYELFSIGRGVGGVLYSAVVAAARCHLRYNIIAI